MALHAATRNSIRNAAWCAGCSDGRCRSRGSRFPRIAITFDDAFMSVVENALPELVARKMPCTIFVPTGCLGCNPTWQLEGSSSDSAEVVASGEVLRSLISMGVRLGAHSRSHPLLTRIRPQDARTEIIGSKADLENLLDRPVDLFAFPYGDFNSQTLWRCKEAGYRFVFSIAPGSVDPMDTEMLRPRIAVEPSDTRLEFWLKLRGGYNWMPLASAIKRNFLGQSR